MGMLEAQCKFVIPTTYPNQWGIVFFRYCFNPLLSPELTLVVSMHANQALIKSTD